MTRRWPTTSQRNMPPPRLGSYTLECHCPVGPSPGPNITLPTRPAARPLPLPLGLIRSARLDWDRSGGTSDEFHAPPGHDEASPLPPPPPRLLCCGGGVRGGGGGRDGLGRRRRGPVGPGEPVRVHGVRAHGVHLEGRHGLDDRGHAAGRRRLRDPDRGPRRVGRPHGRRPRLLRARQPGHLQRPGPLHAPGALRHEPHLRRRRRAPRLVLQLPRGHRHGAPPRVRAAALHRRAVARHRRTALPPLLRRRQVRREAPLGGCRRAVNPKLPDSDDALCKCNYVGVISIGLRSRPVGISSASFFREEMDLCSTGTVNKTSHWLVRLFRAPLLLWLCVVHGRWEFLFDSAEAVCMSASVHWPLDAVSCHLALVYRFLRPNT